MAEHSLATLHSAVDQLEPDSTANMRVKALIIGLSFVLLDILIVYGPLRKIIPRAFKLNPETEHKQSRRVTSQVAARVVGFIFLTSIFPLAYKVLTNPEFLDDKLHYYNQDSIQCLLITAGYFFYDIMICLFRFDENGAAFLLHATLCGFAYLFAATSHQIHWFGCAYLTWELSTPLLYVRWVLLKRGLAGSRAMTITNGIFMAIFFSCRIVYGPMLSYDFYKTTQHDLLTSSSPIFGPAVGNLMYAAMVTLNCLNYYWFWQMFSAVLGVSNKHMKTKAV